MKAKVLFNQITIPGVNSVNDFIINSGVHVYMPSDTAEYKMRINIAKPPLLDVDWTPCGQHGDENLIVNTWGDFFSDVTYEDLGQAITVRSNTLNVRVIESAQTNFGNSFGIDQISFVHSLMPGGKCKIETNGVGLGSGHAYVNNRKWWRLYHYGTDSMIPVLIASNIDHIIVNNKNKCIYGYTDDDVTFGYFQFYNK